MDSPVFLNPAARERQKGITVDASALDQAVASQVLAFHQRLPQYAVTPLVSLDSLAEELGVGYVLVKDESNRFGLPSFKILGASWAIFCALATKLGLDPAACLENAAGNSSLWAELGAKAKEEGLSLVACSEGNWGRAVARLASYFDIPATILVPEVMPESTRNRIRSEGVQVVQVDGNYDDGVSAAQLQAANNDKVVLVMDMGWDGYQDVPHWVVDGYSTMLNETDAQVLAMTGGSPATHAFIPVGVGSIAHAVTRHYKNANRPEPHSIATVITVEPDTAACLKASLQAGQPTTVQTEDSIMCGMNCGTISSTAWPTLRDEVDADVTVTDPEAHAAACALDELNVKTGPCGAATLAALKTVLRVAKDDCKLGPDSVVVLFCTEGKREYQVPK
ncbi:tryptophan synthase beta subunit-like PLP-dependent enzyme [Coniella lustricola]|uniref:Tryptophan synthase beta subunit-like PLP-dependent enzyme n=1 Tax=Coniella lustricola TaxID=2025994 RepID=A0A2T3A7G3_9PEZI|nr:tryptophan synthase beta subunit-like PLP-dependent enzyme [Coniella lustricola]